MARKWAIPVPPPVDPVTRYPRYVRHTGYGAAIASNFGELRDAPEYRDTDQITLFPGDSDWEARTIWHAFTRGERIMLLHLDGGQTWLDLNDPRGIWYRGHNDGLRTLRDELFVSAVDLSTKATRTKLLGDSRTADAMGAAARAVKAIGARVEELMGVA